MAGVSRVRILEDGLTLCSKERGVPRYRSGGETVLFHVQFEPEVSQKTRKVFLDGNMSSTDEHILVTPSGSQLARRMLDFGQFDFGQFDFGQLAEIELAEVEIGRSRNWPKSKLIGRSRTDGVCSVPSFSRSFFFICLAFTFLYFFLVLTHLSLHFVSVLFLFSSPKT